MAEKIVPLVFGVLLLIGAAFFLLATLGFSFGTSSSPPDPGLAAFSATCTAIFAFPGVLLMVLYRHAARRDARTAALVALLQNVREVPIADIARTIQQSPTDAIVLISEAINARRVHGYIDSTRGVFVALPPGVLPPLNVRPEPPRPPSAQPEAPPPAPMEPRFCRECGSRLERVPGQTGYACPNCGHVEPG